MRKTARRHGLNTDSSFRFERGIDPQRTVYALKRAALLFRELAGGKISSEIVDIYPNPVGDFRFNISFARINALIGKVIPEQTVRNILAALEVKIEAEHNGVLSVAVPPYRVDVQREADLIEDILRIYGYNNVEIPEHVNSTLSYQPRPDKNRLVNIISDLLSDNGFVEIMSNSLTKAAYYEGLDSFPAEHCVRILNPLSADLNVLRQTLLFNALEAVQLNVNHRNGDLKLYEFGNCYFFNESADASKNPLDRYSEGYRLALTVTGAAVTPSWNVRPEQSSFFTLRSYAERILKRLGIDIYSLRSTEIQNDIFADALSVEINGKPLLQMGAVTSKIRSMFDLKQEVYYLELDFDRLREIAFATEKRLLKSVSLFDVYQGDKLPAGKKSYALNFVLEDRNQTLTDKIIDRTMSNLVEQFERQAGAQVRS